MREISNMNEGENFVIQNGILCQYTGSDETVMIPDGVTEIADGVFEDCEQRKSLSIPDSIAKMGINIYASICIEAFHVSPNNTAYASKDGVLFSKDHTKLIRCPANRQGKYVIPEGVTEICEGAFYRCRNLTNIVIPESVETIKSAFSWCENLTRIIIPHGVKNLEAGAFLGCINLTAVTLPDDLKFIGGLAFSGCSKLTTISIPDSVEGIFLMAFVGCENLMNVRIPNGVTELEEYTFLRNKRLTHISIPENVKKIGRYAFGYCTGLTSITISEGVIEIAERAFLGCKNLAQVFLPATITTIGRYAFRSCKNLTIHAPKGSYAERYARKRNIPFVAELDRDRKSIYNDCNETI